LEAFQLKRRFEREEFFMYFESLFIGIASFLVIGIFHPIVIKVEYYFSYKVWPFFLIFGLCCCTASVIWYVNTLINTIVSLIGFASLWTILELIHQKKRVEKGWFPKNPNRKIPYED